MAERKSFLLRLDGHTVDLLKEWAEDEFRSLNGHLEFLLHDALKRSSRWKPPPAIVPAKEPEKADE